MTTPTVTPSGQAVPGPAAYPKMLYRGVSTTDSTMLLNMATHGGLDRTIVKDSTAESVASSNGYTALSNLLISTASAEIPAPPAESEESVHEHEPSHERENHPSRHKRR